MTDVQENSKDIERFDRYQLLFHLATGGMAQLYVGRLKGLAGFEKLMVIKLIHEEYARDESFIKMFLDEARLAARITHPNVVQVVELGQVDDSYFIAMEYVSGESLEALSRLTEIPLTMCARIIADAAAGLHSAHELTGNDGALLNVVHRDVSPSNILISYDGSVKVTDFGVARARINRHVTVVGTIKGKYGYLSPEYAAGGGVDRRSDVFSLGTVLYEISTRTRLFKCSSPEKSLFKVTTAPIVPPSMIVDGYPKRLEKILLRALERDPEGRYQTAQEMGDALEGYIVESGAPALKSDLVGLMQETFEERISLKQELIQQAEHTATLPEVKQEASPSTTLQDATRGQIEREELRARRSQRIIIWSSVILLVAGIFALVVFLLLPEPLPGAAHAKKALRKTEIVISIHAIQAGAEISFEGKRAPSPFNARRPPKQGTSRAEITAPGHRPHRIDVPLDRGGSWVIKLVADRRDAGAGADVKSGTDAGDGGKLADGGNVDQEGQHVAIKHRSSRDGKKSPTARRRPRTTRRPHRKRRAGGRNARPRSKKPRKKGKDDLFGSPFD